MERLNYSKCVPCPSSEHKQHASEWVHAKNRAERDRIEKLHGFRNALYMNR